MLIGDNSGRTGEPTIKPQSALPPAATAHWTATVRNMPRAKEISRQRPPRSKERLHGSIAHRLGVAIVSGRIKPGETLDNEVDSSERLAVSRTAYREAVRILAAKGLVVSRPKLGTQVRDKAQWHLLDPEVLSWLFESQPSHDLVVGLFELRSIIEPEAAALAAERRSADDLSTMRAALQAMERHGLAGDEGQSADREFHRAVLAATRNPPLYALSSSIGAAVRWTTIFKQRKRRLPRDPVPDHWRVFEAIDAGDAAAARVAMRCLVALALEDTRLAMKS
jgi:DNA-binding FadR family transcriptional regulator